ncbi:MAG: type II toxin-antitoxin system VapC family toxin [Novosphingobium sp.]|nr:type II toxin-antitoxin system VapC family toxin [Novosphingobium sp.]
MIIHTSALIAILTCEDGSAALIEALGIENGIVPAPVILEFLRVARGERIGLASQAEALLDRLVRYGHATAAFTAEHATLAAEAEKRYGKGNGRGGLLNLLDLMVYAVAKERGEPLLCTGKDFAATDLDLHAASRPF